MIEFKSKTALIEHIKELEKSGYLISSSISEPIMKRGKHYWKFTKIFKINFNNIPTKNKKGNDEIE